MTAPMTTAQHQALAYARLAKEDVRWAQTGISAAGSVGLAYVWIDAARHDPTLALGAAVAVAAAHPDPVLRAAIVGALQRLL